MKASHHPVLAVVIDAPDIPVSGCCTERAATGVEIVLSGVTLTPLEVRIS